MDEGTIRQAQDFAEAMTLRCQYMTIVLNQMAKYRSDLHEDDVVTWVEDFDDPDAPNLKLTISRLGADLKIVKGAHHTVYISKAWTTETLSRILSKILSTETYNDL